MAVSSRVVDLYCANDMKVIEEVTVEYSYSYCVLNFSFLDIAWMFWYLK